MSPAQSSQITMTRTLHYASSIGRSRGQLGRRRRRRLRARRSCVCAGAARPRGPHLDAVPWSTLEICVRKFERFCPDIKVRLMLLVTRSDPCRLPTCRSKRTTAARRVDMTCATLLVDDSGGRGRSKPSRWEVLVTTYNFAQSRASAVGDLTGRQLSLTKVKFSRTATASGIRTCSESIQTGDCFSQALRCRTICKSSFLSRYAIFKVKNDATKMHRTTREKIMMQLFAPRRRKNQMLKDLPSKTERIV
ncbi:hypothetical protein BKA62DRAFT_209958 [Auriculariales sp. MPI-PUGE-AT-0066]|nr:hypothetical protein BKA62DRAFT_209958 [Auriculariales sp. MPI-PUGE-AT-0066]